jgi:glyoxylase-like metal-dependent hydrolase (beta-lactamase superfamily II)
LNGAADSTIMPKDHRMSPDTSDRDMHNVAEGVHQLEIPMRHNPLGKTYSYLLEEARTLIDTGVPTGQAFTALEEQLGSVGLRVSDLERVIVTHMHTDHIGLVDRIREKADVAVLAHEESIRIQKLWTDMRKTIHDDLRSEIVMFGGRDFLGILNRFENAIRRPRWRLDVDETIEDGAFLEMEGFTLEAIWTPGHSPEHICLFDGDRGVLYSGDHVLPKITSHISHHTFVEGDPLQDYLKALERVRGLPARLVLPGHERAFRDLRGRISELEAHHERRCNEIKDSLRSGEKTVFEVSSLISWDSKPWPEMRFWTKRMAAAETYAHLVYLGNREEVKESLRGGVLYFRLG